MAMKHLATSKGAHFVAKKSFPPRTEEERESSAEKEQSQKRYTNYLAFVDDPKSRTPFTVLPASKIQNYRDKNTIDNSYLSKSRRKRKYDVAFTTVFKFTCRIFAKCEAFVKLTDLHEIVQGLNNSYMALMTCNVDVENAYETLIDSNAKKVKVGVNYDTGKVVNKRARVGKPPDTATSVSEKSESEDEGDLNRQEEETQVVGRNEDNGAPTLNNDSGDEEDGGSEVETPLTPPEPPNAATSLATSTGTSSGSTSNNLKSKTDTSNAFTNKEGNDNGRQHNNERGHLGRQNHENNSTDDINSANGSGQHDSSESEEQRPSPNNRQANQQAPTANTGGRQPSAPTPSNKSQWAMMILNQEKILKELANLRHKNEVVQEYTYKGLKATKNVITDQSTMLRDLKYEVNNLKTMLVDAKAISHTLPHAEIKDYIPFRNDEDVITVMSDTNLTNALYAKVIEIKVNSPNFVHTFVDTLFHDDYRARRAYPATSSRSEKNKVPSQIKPFIQTYMAKHIRDKMDEVVFFRSLCRSFTTATYNNTEAGQLAKALGANNSKLRRRNNKVTLKTLQLKELQAEAEAGTLTSAKRVKMRTVEFELKQAKLDVEHLKEEIEAIQEVKEKRKDEEETGEAEGNTDTFFDQENTEYVDRPSPTILETDDHLFNLLGVNTATENSDSEVQFTNL